MSADMSDPPTMRRWPTGTEYAEAVQQPTQSFSDAELSGGRLTLTPLGLPAMASGQSAVAFHFQTADQQVAVRCLLSAHEDGRQRYQALESHLAKQMVSAVVPARWIDEGVRVHAAWWPVVIMPWATGRPLHDAVEERLTDPARLIRLADRWFDLVEQFQARSFAHGDLQHGNVLLTDDDEFQLVDLDGIWVPDMDVGAPDEYGHPNYQHARRSAQDWGPFVDTFSALVIGLSLTALGSDPTLSRFLTGENLLFGRDDFVDVSGGAIWRELARSGNPEVADLSGRLASYALASEPPAVSLAAALVADVAVVRAATFSSALAAVAVDTTASSKWWEPSSAAPAPSTESTYWGANAAVASAVAGSAAGQPSAGGPATQGAVATGDPALTGRATGLARVTGRPVVAGLVAGGLAGIVGSLVAGVVQQAVGKESLNVAIFVGLIAAFLGGFVAAWPSLNLKAYGAAFTRFLLGFVVALGWGFVAVVIADQVIQASLIENGEKNVLIVMYVWAITAALIGLAIGMLRSPKAAALAFTAGATAGAIGGLVHGSTSARFENSTLVVDGLEPATMLLATGVAMIIGVAIALALRTARSGSFTVIDGVGQGSTVDFHSKSVSIGGSNSDTLVLARSNVPPKAVRLTLRETGASANSSMSVLVDGQAQVGEFELSDGQVLGVGGVFIRVSFHNDGADS